MKQTFAKLSKWAPAGEGQTKVKNVREAVKVAGSGAGFDMILRAGDAILLGGAVQNFAVQVPFVGITFSAIDSINWVAHNGGEIIPKSVKPIIAVGSAKFVQGSLTTSGLFRKTGVDVGAALAGGNQSQVEGGGL